MASPGAVEALALQLVLPVTVNADLPGRAPLPVESAAYFAIAECLANVVKHSGADRAWVTLAHATLLTRADREMPLARLTAREREVLALMAEGRSNAAIAGRLVVTQAAVGKHINSIFTKLGLPMAPDDNRRVLTVLAYLQG